ncbi:MAG: Fic family protein [Trebonia sp.]
MAADVTDAEAAIRRLNAEASALADTEALARLLLRAESVASSRIEGLEIGARKLLRAEAAQQLGERSHDVTAEEVLGNIDAMNGAVREIGSGDPITVDMLLRFHGRLMAGSRDKAYAGQLRNRQNWIGGSEHNPCSAAFVPPPPERVPDLLADLCSFCNDESLPAVAQAAIAHAQFETIHPFADGNGRTGRGLIHLVLRRRGLATRVLPPVSLVLATWASDYVDGLVATRYRGPATGKEAHAGLNRWVGRFAGACVRAVDDAAAFEMRVNQIEDTWRAQLGRVRGGSATDLLLRSLPGAPILTVNGAAQMISRSFTQTNDAAARLADAGILSQVNVGKRNRAFEAKAVINAFSDLERQLASPAGDTRTSAPSRPVTPRRPTSLFRAASNGHDGPYDVVLIDEVGAATLPEVLLAVAKAATLEALRDVESGGGPLAEVGTARSFQGREFPVVVFDTVEALYDGNMWIGQASLLPGSSPWRQKGVRLFNVATTRVQHRLYVIASRDRVLNAKPGTALGHLGTLLRDRQVRSLSATTLITPTGDGSWYWRCCNPACPDCGKGKYRAWTRAVVLRSARN